MAQQLHILERGTGPALVLLHGFPLDCRVWDQQVAELSDEYRVIAPDLPGFGQSPSIGKFTMESLADVVHQALTELGALPCVLGGLSMGGYVSQAFVAKYVRNLRGLMLIDTRSNADTEQGKLARNEMIELAKTRGSAAVAEQMMPKMLAPSAGADLTARLKGIMNACPAETIQFACAAMRDRPDYTPMLQELTLPTLILSGELDVIAPPVVAEQMHRAVSGSKLALIAGAGHMAPMERPKAVSAAMRRFLRTIPA
jgi:3-oxoadipate enol-lactonase